MRCCSNKVPRSDTMRWAHDEAVRWQDQAEPGTENQQRRIYLPLGSACLAEPPVTQKCDEEEGFDKDCSIEKSTRGSESNAR
jgi:hypothetical protein